MSSSSRMRPASPSAPPRPPCCGAKNRWPKCCCACANRDFCQNALARMPGVTVPEPEGAFYLFPKIRGLTDSFDFCKRLLPKTQVGLAPGVAFGTGGEGRLRATDSG